MTPRKPNRPRTLAGFTLIELMAAMAVFSILLVMLLRVFTGSVKTFNAGTGLSKQTSESRLVLDHIARLIESNHFDLKPGTGGTSELKIRDDDDCSMIVDEIIVAPRGPTLGLAGSQQDRKLIQKHFGTVNSDVPLLDHVVDFQVRVFDESLMPGGGSMGGLGGNDTYPIAGGNTCSNAPVMAVIFLETLSDHNAKIENQNPSAFDESSYSQRYYRTVYLRKFLATQ